MAGSRLQVRLEAEGAGKEEVTEAKAALMRAAEVHPNHPTLTILLRRLLSCGRSSDCTGTRSVWWLQRRCYPLPLSFPHLFILTLLTSFFCLFLSRVQTTKSNANSDNPATKPETRPLRSEVKR